MRVAIVENGIGTQYGQVGVALAEAGAEIVSVQPRLGQPLPDRILDFDALIVLGGEQNALADGEFPYLAPLAGAMRDMVLADKAVLGICLGAQLMARGFGGDNLIGTVSEFGWTGISQTTAAQDDPVFAAVPQDFSSFQWHSDTFTIPPGAVRLAQNTTVAQQAFRIGRAGYATQFHFEANRHVVRGWIHDLPDAMEAAAPGWIANHAKAEAADAPAADAFGLALARAFVARIR